MPEIEEKKKYSEENKDKYEYDQKYFKEKYTQVKLSMPNAEAEALNNYCEKHNVKKATLIRQLIKERIEQDN